jgi:putative endonuclease
MFYVYVFKSEKDGSFYIGQTGDRDKRVAAHNEGRSRWTKSKRPWMLVYSERYPTRSEAVKRERYLKSLKSHVEIEKLILTGCSPDTSG